MVVDAHGPPSSAYHALGVTIPARADQSMNHSAIPKQKTDYFLEMLDGELILYHLDETRILYCSRTASIIWDLCDGQQTIEEIIALLSEAYPDAAGTMASDVEEALQQFLDAGSIELL